MAFAPWKVLGNIPVIALSDSESISKEATTIQIGAILIHIDGNSNFDKFRASGVVSGVSGAATNTKFDEIVTGTAIAFNTAPTASNFTANPSENLVYTFATGDFGYNDGDGDPLNSIRIDAAPTTTQLFLDANDNGVYDAPVEALTNGSIISKADLDANRLKYIQNGSTNTSFTFSVNDGTVFSASSNTATLTMLGIPTVTLSLSPVSNRNENFNTPINIIATLSNAYGANVTVNLGFGGTATGGMGFGADYSVGGSSIIINAGANSNSTTITNVDDFMYEGNETVVIDITGVTNGTENGMQQVTYTINENDPVPNVQFELQSFYDPTSENGGVAYLSAELDAAVTVTVTVPVTFSGTATQGTDYSISSANIVIAPGDTKDSIAITGINDMIIEGNETIIIDMGTPTNGTEDGTQQVTLTLSDDDDVTPPDVVLTSSVFNGPTNAASFTVDVDFSEDITGLLLTDFSVTNANVSALNSSNDSTFSFTVTPTITNGTVTVQLPANRVQDGAGNNNSASNTLNIAIDNTAPTITSISRLTPATSPTNSNALVFRVVFNEDMDDVDVADFDPTGTNANATNVSGSGDTYDVTVSGGNLASFNGTVSLGFAGGQNIRDEAGNALANTTPTGTNQSYVVDNAAPTFENSTPNITGITQTGFTLNIDMNEAGIAYFVVVADGDPAPTVANVIAGQGNGGSTPVNADNSTINTGAFVDNLLASGLTAGTPYDVYVVLVDDLGNQPASPTQLDISTLNAEPTIAATSITFSSVTTTSMTVGWTNGNGTNRLVIARATSAVNQTPSDATGYTANATFGSGSDLGSSNFVVYNGTGNSVNVTGLSVGTTYHFTVIEFNGSGTISNYRLTGAPVGNRSTLESEPTTPATSITFSSVAATSMTVNWTSGNGNNRLVIAREGAAVNQTPTDGTVYTANTTFGSGSNLGSGNYVVYGGTGNSVTVTGLTAGTVYHFTVIEFDGSGVTANYRFTGAPVGNRSTLESEPTTPASAITFSSVATTSMTVNWTSGNGTRRVVVARASSAVNQDPADGTVYTANAIFGSGSNLGSNNFVIYDGTGNSVSLTNLTAGTTYHFKVIEYNGTTDVANYRLTGAPTASQATSGTEPTIAASSITFSAVGATSMTVNWTSGNGANRLVIARASSAVNQSPADGAAYTANAAFGSGSDLGSNNFVVFSGTGNSVTVTGLTAGTVYHFTVIEFNGSAATANYRLTGAPTGNRSTLDTEPTTPANTITFSSITTGSMTVNWTNGNGARRIVVARAGFAVNRDPVDGTGYTANAFLGAGSNLGNANFVVYDGTGSSVSLSGLIDDTRYHFKVIEFNGSGATANYRLTGAPVANQATVSAEPNTAASNITFSAVTTNSMTLNWTNGNGNQRLVIARAAAAVNQTPTDGTGYTSNLTFGSGDDLGSGNFVVFRGSGNLIPITGLTAGTVYHFTVIEFNGSGVTANYRLTGAPVASRSTLAAEPTVAASALTCLAVAPTTMTIGWTSGNGTRRIVVARASSTVNQNPTDGTNYTANAAFGSGSDLGSSNFVVYDGTGNSVSLTGLTAGTTYHFKIFEYNGTGVTTNYFLTSPSNSKTTLVNEPTTAASSITFSAVTTTSMTVGWTNGNGTNRMVIARASSAVNQQPVDASTGYTANAAFGSGTDLGSGNFIVYSGTGNSVNVTGLSASTTYHFEVVEFNGAGASANYLLTSVPTGSRSTLVAEPTTPASTITFSSVTATSMTVNWTSGNGTRRIVVARASAAVNQDPVDGNGYAPNAVFGSGSDLGSSNFVVYDGTGNSVNVTGLSSGVTYHFKVIEFNGTTVTANYRLTGAPVASQATPVAEPTTAASGITFSSVTANSMTVNWTSGNGANRLVIARATSAVSQTPTDGAGYTANAAFGSGSDLGSSNFVVYSGTGNSVTVTGLSANTTYHFTVIEFSGSGATANYLLTGAPTGNRSTLVTEPTTPASTITFSAITTTGMNVNWTSGNGTRRVVVAKAGAAVDQDPIDGTGYTANAAFGSGSDLGSSNFVVYDGTGSTVSLTGLTAGTTYHFKVIEFNGTGLTSNYRLTGAPTANQATMSAEPTTPANTMTFSAVTTTSMTVGWINGNGSNRLVIARATSAVNQTPTDGTAYTANAAFGSGSDLGSSNFVVYSGTGNSVNVTGLTVGTVYHFTVIEFNGTGVTANYRLTGAPTGNRSTLLAEPTTPANTITFSSVGTTSMTVNWTSGNGARRVVVAKASTAVDQDPTDGTGYTANAVFGSGSNLGSGNFVVYDGTGNSVSLTGLSSGVTYHFKVIEFNGTGLTANYRLIGAPIANQATTVAEPTTAASTITFSAVTANSMTVNWTSGNGANRLVIAREASAVNQTPTDGASYTANAAFGSGSDLGSNNFVVYSGTGNSVNVTGLTAGTVYHFTVVEFNGSAATANYFLTGAPTGNRSTLAAEPTTPANTINFSAITATSMTVGWTNGNGARRVVIAKVTSAVDQDPADGTGYTANAAFGSGSDLGGGNFIIYDGMGNSVTLTGLNSLTTYHFKVIEYNGTGLTANYRLTGAPTASQSSADAIAPTVTSIDRQTPGTSPTNADVVVFRVVFSEAVQNVGSGDFAVTGPTGASIGVSGSGTTYDVTVSGGDMAGLNATVTLTLSSTPTIQDLATNALTNTTPTGTNNNTFVIDNTAPTVTSFTRKTPMGQLTNADVVTFLATFSEDVTSVGIAAFGATGPTGATISVSQLTASTYDVQISGGDLAALNGTVGLNLLGGAITDLAGNAITVAEPGTDETYTLDNSAPGTVSFTRKNPATATTSNDQVTFLATFSEDVTGVGTADFAVTGTTGGVSSVTQVTASTYDVVVSGGDLATLNGTVGLNFAAGVMITDLAGNALPNTEPGTDDTYTLCNGPNNQVTGITFGTITANSIGVASFTAPAGGAAGYVVKINSANTFTTPTDGALPSTSLTWADAGEQVVYAGTSVAPNVTITGLTSGVTYFFKVFAYNDCSGTNTFESTGTEANTDTPKANQTITFGALISKNFGDAPFNLTGTASSGLAVSYTSSNTAVATISGNTVTITGVGTTTITASQAGNTNFNAATDVTQTLTVNKGNQTITFTLGADANKVVGAADFTLNGTASSGLVVSYTSSNTAVATVSGNTVTIVGPGTTDITASQAGDANYNAATDVVQTLTVSDAPVMSVTAGSNTLTSGTGTYNFGNVDVNQSSTAITFTIANSGGADLQLSGNPAVTVSGANSAEFIVTQPTSTTVSTGSNITFQVVFTPTAAGTRTATVSIANNSSTNPYTFTLTGEGILVANNLALPNLFTPNGDGSNDAFIVSAPTLATVTLRIYNRKGAVVFSSTDVNEVTQTGWNGELNGKKLPTGTYIWQITGTFQDGSPVERKTGEVYLMR